MKDPAAVAVHPSVELCRPMRPFARAVLCAILVLAYCGCSGRKPVYPVAGRVVDAGGKPVPGATVIFCPIENLFDNANKPAGWADDEGNFSLTTYDQEDGAPAGEYVVTVELRTGSRSPKRPRQAPPDRLGGKFSDPNRSPLRATIIKGENDVQVSLP
jgi:hypothetical protein